MPTMPKKLQLQQIGRLAMRQEGDMWNAYYAMPGTMQDAILLGGILMRIILDRPERKELFMGLMREAVSDIIEQASGIRPVWPNKPGPAPEHERGGNVRRTPPFDA